MTTVDQRVRAALSVLRGRAAEDVAAELGVEVELVHRWQDLLLEGGRMRLAGRMEPSAFEARERFLTLIAHELRTPLAVIGGWVETLSGAELTPEASVKALAAIAKQVESLERFTRNALDAGAVARSQLRLAVRRVDLRRLVESVMRAMQEGPEELEPGPALDIIADDTRLEQVVGDVLAHSRRVAGGGPIGVVLAEVGGVASMTVTVIDADLSFDEAAALFEPYGRSDTSVGTGLGLFLSRALLAAHGGEIGVRSDGDATQFWFRLPAGGPEPGSHVERT